MRKRQIGVLALLAFALAAPSADAAVLDCGPTYQVNDSWQYGARATIEAIIQTRRSINVCPVQVQVEGWVRGFGSATTSRATYVAELHMFVPVPYYGTWLVYGKHWLIYWGGYLQSQWNYLGTTRSAVDLVNYAAIDSCASKGGEWDGEKCIIANTPVIVDVGHDGYRLTSAANGVQFDLDADGSPEPIAWTEADSDDAFLAMDRNNNGRIDDGSELFGDRTPAYADEREPTTQNGFAALVFAEGPSYGGGRADGVIDARDAVFSRLLLWCDRNHNGVSEPDELTSVAQSGLKAIRTDVKAAGRTDRFGNQFRLRAKGVWQDGEHYIYDVWLMPR
ncbi:MAG TPA: hypothetical protein VF159_11790 [Gemmatimonadaceae bacterium]|nr:hypothetical protein [Vicinamibacterales bacterium]